MGFLLLGHQLNSIDFSLRGTVDFEVSHRLGWHGTGHGSSRARKGTGTTVTQFPPPIPPATKLGWRWAGTARLTPLLVIIYKLNENSKDLEKNPWLWILFYVLFQFNNRLTNLVIITDKCFLGHQVIIVFLHAWIPRRNLRFPCRILWILSTAQHSSSFYYPAIRDDTYRLCSKVILAVFVLSQGYKSVFNGNFIHWFVSVNYLVAFA